MFITEAFRRLVRLLCHRYFVQNFVIVQSSYSKEQPAAAASVFPLLSNSVNSLKSS